MGYWVVCPFSWVRSVTAPCTRMSEGTLRLVKPPDRIKLSRFVPAAMSCFETMTAT